MAQIIIFQELKSFLRISIRTWLMDQNPCETSLFLAIGVLTQRCSISVGPRPSVSKDGSKPYTPVRRRFSDSLPGLERLARRFDEVEGLLPAERAGQVVIRLVACLLEADEGVRHTLQIGWGRVAFTRRLHCLWKLVVRDHRGGLLHLPVVVRPVDPRSKPWLSGVQGRCLRCEQMEQRVVGRRDGTTEVRLLGTTGVELGELLCLFQEVGVETHDASTASAGSAIGRNERYGHRSGATRRAMGSRIARSRCAAFKKSLSFLETSSVRNAQIQRAGSPEWSSPVRKRRSASSGGRSDSIACSISFPSRSASGSS